MCVAIITLLRIFTNTDGEVASTSADLPTVKASTKPLRAMSITWHT